MITGRQIIAEHGEVDVRGEQLRYLLKSVGMLTIPRNCVMICGKIHAAGMVKKLYFELADEVDVNKKNGFRMPYVEGSIIPSDLPWREFNFGDCRFPSQWEYEWYLKQTGV